MPGEAGVKGGEERRKARRLELAAARGSRRGAPGDARVQTYQFVTLGAAVAPRSPPEGQLPVPQTALP